MMGDIFSSCRRVLIWLGETGEEGFLTSTTIKDIGFVRSAYHRASSTGPESTEAITLAFKEFETAEVIFDLSLMHISRRSQSGSAAYQAASKICDAAANKERPNCCNAQRLIRCAMRISWNTYWRRFWIIQELRLAHPLRSQTHRWTTPTP